MTTTLPPGTARGLLAHTPGLGTALESAGQNVQLGLDEPTRVLRSLAGLWYTLASLHTDAAHLVSVWSWEGDEESGPASPDPQLADQAGHLAAMVKALADQATAMRDRVRDKAASDQDARTCLTAIAGQITALKAWLGVAES
jgi:hypothetical protein